MSRFYHSKVSLNEHEEGRRSSSTNNNPPREGEMRSFTVWSEKWTSVHYCLVGHPIFHISKVKPVQESALDPAALAPMPHGSWWRSCLYGLQPDSFSSLWKRATVSGWLDGVRSRGKVLGLSLTYCEHAYYLEFPPPPLPVLQDLHTQKGCSARNIVLSSIRGLRLWGRPRAATLWSDSSGSYSPDAEGGEVGMEFSDEDSNL